MFGRRGGRTCLTPQKTLYRGSAKRRARLPGRSASDGSLLAVNSLAYLGCTP